MAVLDFPDWVGHMGAISERDPNSMSLSVAVNAVAPHAVTLRGTATISEVNKAFVSTIFLQIVRVTAATTGGRVRLWVEIAGYPVGYVSFWRNGIGDSEIVALACEMYLVPNQEIYVYSADASIGGTVDYRATVGYTEFEEWTT